MPLVSHKSVASIRPKAQSGLTLVELIVAMTLSLLVVLAATSLLLSTRSIYILHEERDRLQDTGRYALEVISGSIRQAAYGHFDARGANTSSD